MTKIKARAEQVGKNLKCFEFREWEAADVSEPTIDRVEIHSSMKVAPRKSQNDTDKQSKYLVGNINLLLSLC